VLASAGGIFLEVEHDAKLVNHSSGSDLDELKDGWQLLRHSLLLFDSRFF